jgi:hypothetical protein
MKKYVIGVLSVGMMLVTGSAFAWQQVYDAIVVDYNVDSARHICTIVINKDHPRTTDTAGCNQRQFSWQCLGDTDYRFQLAMGSYKNAGPIHIRYSEYGCHDFTHNMLLLTDWDGYHSCDNPH